MPANEYFLQLVLATVQINLLQELCIYVVNLLILQPCTGYMREGFLSLQHAVDKALIQSQNLTTHNFTVDMRRYPYPPYNDDLMIVVIQTQFPFLVLVSLVFTALNITRSVVHEKERKLKVGLYHYTIVAGGHIGYPPFDSGI